MVSVTPQSKLQDEIDKITDRYLNEHPDFVKVAEEKDAALKGKNEATIKELLHVYPGVIAVAVHEEAHRLQQEDKIFMARQLAEGAKARTGIDIHPGTQIGENLFIDHGTADVIGETTKIGNNTQIMHKVTLGAYANPKERNPEKLAHRHPEVGNDCFIGVGVEVLGNVKIGNQVKISSDVNLHGNDIVVGDGVRIGTGAIIEDGCSIAPGVKIGEGAFIGRGCKNIAQDVPEHSEVFRDEAGDLHVIARQQERALQGNGRGRSI